jgi:hypothetical protein
MSPEKKIVTFFLSPPQNTPLLFGENSYDGKKEKLINLLYLLYKTYT